MERNCPTPQDSDLLDTPTASRSFLAQLTERLDAHALQDLDQFSAGKDDFLVFMLRKADELLTGMLPGMEQRLAARQFAAMADDVHKLKSSVSYIGEKKLDRMANRAEPVLRALSASSTSEAVAEAQALATEVTREVRVFLDWLRACLAQIPA